jgi:phage tail-like protein
MSTSRPGVALAHADQWVRCWHQDTALVDGGGVELTWSDPTDSRDTPDAEELAGLAFDGWCRGYRSRPEHGRVDVSESGEPPADPERPGVFRRPRGLAVDEGQRLYVTESCGHAVSVIDLSGQRLLRRVPISTASEPHQQPIDVAAECCTALVLCDRPPRLLILEGRRAPKPGPRLTRPRCARKLDPVRIAAGTGGVVLVLWASPHHESGVVADLEGDVVAIVRRASDLSLAPDGVLIVARQPGQAFLRYRREGTRWTRLHAVGARGYDGAAIAVAPNGRIAYTTDQGWSFTSGDAARYVAEGQVITYRLDSGRYQNRWGRLFLDACIPPGTSIATQFITSDADEVGDPLAPSRPRRGDFAIRHGELTPTLPSRSSVQGIAPPRGLHRRSEGREWPWAQIDVDDSFETYESPVFAAPGRYLWVVLTLAGNASTGPRLRAMRIETAGHGLVEQLPRILAPTEPEAVFLHRFLEPAEGVLRDLDARAADRDILVNPASTPQEALAWLGSFAGLVLDRRWPLAARRQLVAQTFELFALRGTVACLERILTLYLCRPVRAIENWRLRGLGGGILGEPAPGPRPPGVLGGLRVGGQLGKFTVGGTVPGRNGYSATAHRFTVVVPVNLDDEQRAVISSIAESHKPAHTTFGICEMGDGMRIGHGTRLDLTTVVGPGSGWGDATLGDSLLGADRVVGTPAIGARLGQSTSSAWVRVG